MKGEGQQTAELAPILLVNVGTVLGGAEVYIDRLATLLMGRVRMIAFCAHSGLADQLHSVGVTVIQLPALRWRRLNRSAKYLSALLAMIYLVFRYRIRVIHFNGYQTSFLIPIAKLLGATALITPHHLPNSGLFRWWYKLTARWADGAINVSGVMNQTHRDLLPSVPSAVIPNWAPQPAALQVSLSPMPKRKLLFVGRLVGNKGLSTLLDAVREFDRTIELLVCGEGPLRDEYEIQAKNLPVTFLGYAPELHRLYSEVDALVIPSLGPEGSCLVALEAMSYGLPCIMSGLPVFKEIAENGKAALIFEAGEAKDLVRAIRQLMTDREQIMRMVKYAQSLVEREYSEYSAMNKYLLLFSKFQSALRRELSSENVL
jgi:glycosyltransferase involved in cell wall biosynthesis